MPTHTSKDSKGCYAQWGTHGKKYYYTCNDSAAKQRAIAKANKQGQAAHASGHTSNDEGDKQMFQYVTTNIKPVVRHDSMEGRDFLVAPTQMITEGVHNGSDGPIFYPAEELAKNPAVWNHKPVVVYHPSKDGPGKGSACDPFEVTQRKVGVLMGTLFNNDSKKLASDAWLDMDRVTAIDKRIAKAVENNEMMEVSTGLFMELERVEGEWNGEEYIGIARNIQPDHLAILPDQKGACSIEDGAGLLRTNAERSFDETTTLLRGFLRTSKPESDAWIIEVYDDYFIYEEAGALLKQNYTISKGKVSFDGMPTTVERQITYKEVTLSANNNVDVKGIDMDKKKIVDELIANEKTSWAEEHRETLMGLDDAVLTNMHKDIGELVKAAEKKAEPPVANKTEEKKDEKKTEPITNVSTEQKAKTVAEYVANAPDEIRGFLEDGVATMNEKKQECIKAILANERNTFTQENLERRDIRELQAMAALATEPEPVANNDYLTIPLYNGQQGAPTGGKPVVPMKLPVMNFETKTA